MSRPAFLFRPDLRKPEPAQAWDLLSAQPHGTKNACIAKALAYMAQQESLEETLRRVLREELERVAQLPQEVVGGVGQIDHPPPTTDDTVPEVMMDFLSGL